MPGIGRKIKRVGRKCKWCLKKSLNYYCSKKCQWKNNNYLWLHNEKERYMKEEAIKLSTKLVPLKRQAEVFYNEDIKTKAQESYENEQVPTVSVQEEVRQETPQVKPKVMETPTKPLNQTKIALIKGD